ncbi:WD40 repeat domain-containing protein [bacterium]|nr:WD40 repeat domain-containing protein [bacterium]
MLNPEANAGPGTLYAATVTDLTTGKSLGGFEATRGEPQPGPYSLSGAVSPDGKTVAIQYCAEVSLYSLPDGKLLHRLDDNGRVFRHVAFTPDGKKLVVGTLDRLHLDVWDVATGRQVMALTAPGAGTGGVSVAPDGKTVAAAVNRQEREKLPEGGSRAADHPESEVVTWNLETGKLARRIAADAPVRSVHCLRDGTVVGVVDRVARFDRSDLRRWRLADGKLLWSAATDHGIRAFAASPDGATLAGVGWGGIVTLWDADTGKVRPRTDGHTKAIQSLAFAPDGKTVRTADETEMRTWDAATGRPAGTFTHPEFAGFTAFSADGRVVAAGPNVITDPRRTVAVFDAASGKKLLSVADPDRKAGFGWCGFDLSADGTKLALPVTKNDRIHLQLWDVPAAKLLWDTELPADWPPGRVVLAGDRVRAGWTDLITLDARTGKQLGRADFFKSNVLPPDPSGNTFLYPSPDGRVLGYVIQNTCIVLVDAQTGRLLRRIDTPDETHSPLVFSPDGSRFATSTAFTGTGIHVWRTVDGARLGRLDGAPSRVLAMAWSADGRRLATGSEDGTALVWAAPGGR